MNDSKLLRCSKCGLSSERRANKPYCVHCGAWIADSRRERRQQVIAERESRIRPQRCSECGSASFEQWSDGWHCVLCGSRISSPKATQSKENERFDRLARATLGFSIRLLLGLLMAYVAVNLVLSIVYVGGYSETAEIKYGACNESGTNCATYSEEVRRIEILETIMREIPFLDFTRIWRTRIDPSGDVFALTSGDARTFVLAYVVSALCVLYALLRVKGYRFRRSSGLSTASVDALDWSSGGTIGLDQMPPPGSTWKSSTQTRPQNATGAPLIQIPNRPQTVRSTPGAPKFEPQRNSEEVDLREPYKSAYLEGQELQRRYRGTMEGQFLNSLLTKIVILEMTSMTQDEWIRLATFDPDRAQLAVREKRRLLEELYQGYMGVNLNLAEEIAILCKKVNEIRYVR